MGRLLSPGNYRAYWAPRQGNSPEEWEDAFACNTPAGRFAIADGASESIYAGEWARLLCDEFVADSSPVDEAGPWLGAAQRRWRDHVRGKPAPWHVAEKLEAGAFATFLGLRIEAEGQWRAVATGDSCLFLIRDDALRAAFPVERANEFGSRPDLIGSRHRGPIRAAGMAGKLQAGDRILLMTDALAEWFLAEHEGSHSPWRELDQLTDDGFAQWVGARRKDRRLKNDDTTLVVIETGGDG